MAVDTCLSGPNTPERYAIRVKARNSYRIKTARLAAMPTNAVNAAAVLLKRQLKSARSQSARFRLECLNTVDKMWASSGGGG